MKTNSIWKIWLETNSI